MEAPAPETLFRALENLVLIGAMDGETGDLTEMGRALSKFPLEPTYAKTIMAAEKLGVEDEVLNIVSVLNSGNWRIRPLDKSYLADEAHKQFLS